VRPEAERRNKLEEYTVGKCLGQFRDRCSGSSCRTESGTMENERANQASFWKQDQVDSTARWAIRFRETKCRRLRTGEPDVRS